jgi:hypothetical protein
MSFNNRTYATALTTDIGNVDFSQVMQTNASSVRKSIDETQFVLKWITDNEPTFITDGSVTTTWSGSHTDCVVLMATAEWTTPI